VQLTWCVLVHSGVCSVKSSGMQWYCLTTNTWDG
jgi:hypothetical protein